MKGIAEMKFQPFPPRVASFGGEVKSRGRALRVSRKARDFVVTMGAKVLLLPAKMVA